jgi:hypothetical protein
MTKLVVDIEKLESFKVKYHRRTPHFSLKFKTFLKSLKTGPKKLNVDLFIQETDPNYLPFIPNSRIDKELASIPNYTGIRG